jgi:large subunit ribosomal protein L25
MGAIKELTASLRPRSGKGAAREARRAGLVPAVIYGGKEPPLGIALPHADIHRRIYAGHFLSAVIEIDVEGRKIKVLPRDYQLDPVKDTPVHVDFLRITAGSKIRVDVPVHFKNQDQSPGLKAGGVINIIFHAVEMMVPADNIPSELVVDLAGKVIGDTVHIKDLALPEGCAPTDKANFTLVSIAPPTKDIAAAAAPAAAAPATPEKK